MRAVYIYKRLRTPVLVSCFILMLYMTSDKVTLRHAQLYNNKSSNGARVVVTSITVKTNSTSIESKLKQNVKIDDIIKRIKLKHVWNNTNYFTKRLPSSTSSSSPVTNQKLCIRDDNNSVGNVPVSLLEPQYKELEWMYSWLLPGGRYIPTGCTAKQEVAIVVPFRGRDRHLRTLLYNLHPFLKRQKIMYQIYVVEQAGNATFNKGRLLNTGFKEAMKDHNYTCFIFHDVDLIPENDNIEYACAAQPRHLTGANNKHHYKLVYNSHFGGVVAVPSNIFRKVNGYSNTFFGWGTEDDDMFQRLRLNQFKVQRPRADISHFRMINHTRGAVGQNRHQKLMRSKLNHKHDGISNLQYTIYVRKNRRLFTYILANTTLNSNDSFV